MEKLNRIRINLMQNRNPIINNTVLFVLSYLSVFYLLQITTIVPAFTRGVSIIIYTSCLDFETKTSSVSADIWKSVDNVISIFGTSIIFITILLLVSILLLKKWETEKIQVKRLLLWIVICAFSRLCVQFICGHVFNLWSFNLVTDFLGVTFASIILKFLFVLFVFLFLVLGFYGMSFLVKYVINPYTGNFKEQLKSNYIYPSILGSVILILFFVPYNPRFVFTEPLNALSVALCLYFLVYKTAKNRYNFVEEQQMEPENEKINIILLVLISILMCAIKIFFDKGILLEVSTYRDYFVENVILSVTIAALSIFAIILFVIYKKRKKRKALEQEEERKSIYDSVIDYDNDSSAISRIDMDKYKRNWDEKDNLPD